MPVGSVPDRAVWATEAGIDQLWVATGGRAVDFYYDCGFMVTEVVRLADGNELTILTARLTHSLGSAPAAR
jgi:hypothetical protein